MTQAMKQKQAADWPVCTSYEHPELHSRMLVSKRKKKKKSKRVLGESLQTAKGE